MSFHIDSNADWFVRSPEQKCNDDRLRLSHDAHDDVMQDLLTQRTYLTNLGQQCMLGLGLSYEYSLSSHWLIKWFNDAAFSFALTLFQQVGTLVWRSFWCFTAQEFSSRGRDKCSDAIPVWDGCCEIKKAAGRLHAHRPDAFTVWPSMMPPVVTAVTHQELNGRVLTDGSRQDAAVSCLTTFPLLLFFLQCWKQL